jgi:carboxyl-terminal processing protease
VGDLAPYVREVRTRHQVRVVSDPAFRWLLEEGRAERAAQSRTVVSLLEASRRAERDATRRAQVERENRLRKARGLPLRSVGSEPPTGDRGTDKENEIQDQDVWLAEATQVLSDLLDVMQSSPAVQTAGSDGASSPICLPPFDCPSEAYR